MASATKNKSENDRKLEEAIKQSFPGSDAPASNTATGRETPASRSDRLPPKITKHQIDVASGDSGTKHQSDDQKGTREK